MTKPGRRNDCIIELKGITKQYRPKKSFFAKDGDIVAALNHVDLCIKKGEIFGLVGQSGSGKTTMGRLLVKLEEPTSGSIMLDGKPVTGLRGKALKDYRSRVQMIFQDPYQSLNPHLSVFQTLLEPLSVHNMGNMDQRREKIMHTLETAGLSPPEEYYDRYPHQLSGGQRQRVAIARAIILEPEFIVADAPTSMLDATIGIQLLKLLSGIREKYHVSFLFITHNLAAARYLCDRIGVIHQGCMVEVNKACEIIKNPCHSYTKQLIDVQPGFYFRNMG